LSTDVLVAAAGEGLEGASPPRPVPCPRGPPRGGARSGAPVVGGRGSLKATGVWDLFLPVAGRGLEVQRPRYASPPGNSGLSPCHVYGEVRVHPAGGDATGRGISTKMSCSIPAKSKMLSGDRRVCGGEECVRLRVYLATIDDLLRRTVKGYSCMEKSVISVKGFARRFVAFSDLLRELSSASKGVLDCSTVKALKSASADVDMDVGCMMEEFGDGFKVPISENYPVKAGPKDERGIHPAVVAKSRDVSVQAE